MNIQQAFSGVVGQKRVIQRLVMNLEAMRAGEVTKSAYFIAATSGGKTTLMNAYSKAIALIKKEQKNPAPIIKLNGASLQNHDSFIEVIVKPHILGKHSIVQIDEAHLMHPKIVGFFLTTLEPNDDGISEYTFGAEVLTIDFNYFNLILATTEPQKLPKAFEYRCDVHNLEELTLEDMATIILLRSKQDMTPEAAQELSHFSRGVPRFAVDLVEKVRNYCIFKKIKKFTADDVNDFAKYISLYPLGVREIELRILKLLSDGPMTLRDLSTASGLSNQAQVDIERFLVNRRLMSIQGKRVITGRGLAYIQALKEWEGEV